MKYFLLLIYAIFILYISLVLIPQMHKIYFRNYIKEECLK